VNSILKYPRTQHIEGSRLQYGDEDLSTIPFSEIRGRPCTIEEKMDGANSAISFSDDGNLLLQSRGHYLSGGPREKHFTLFKSWANRYRPELQTLLGTRYIMYGEWLYAKHTIFYTDLPHYFLEFDIYDRTENRFLSTAARRSLLADAPFIQSVKVLTETRPDDPQLVQALITTSEFINNHTDILRSTCQHMNLDTATILQETDPSDLMEGLYIKVEQGRYVEDRFKFVRPSFLTTIIQSETHWLNRPIIPNQLAEGVDIFND
jgi:hypothetical protein